jgi:hypothetical protein
MAQITVEVVQDQDQFLPGESIRTAVRITNRSGQALHLGADNDWLNFSVEARDTVSSTGIPMVGEVPVKGDFILESSQVATKRVNLAPYYAFPQPGRYSVTATVHVKDWDRDISSYPKTFYIIDGTKLWEQYFGVPSPKGATNSMPEVRKYMLQEANYLKGELRLYLRLTDASGDKTLKVFPVGVIVSVSRPQALVDRSSNLHLLYQNSARGFSYTTFNPDGELLVHQTYDYIGTRPRLKVDEAGTISVLGGVRRVTRTDVPPTTDDDDAGAAAEPAPHAPPLKAPLPPKTTTP